MIDIQKLRDNPEYFKKATRDKGYNSDVVNEVLRFDRERRKLLQRVEKLRAERNKLGKDNISRAKAIKKQLQDIEPQLKRVEKSFNELLFRIPNPASSDAPKGKSDKDNKEVKVWGDKPKFDFKPKDHVELSERLDLLDFKRGSKVSGSGYLFLKNEGALLELALVQYGMDFLVKKGFTPIITPDVARSRYYLGTGYVPKGPEAQTYIIEEEDLGLVATSEVTLAGFHADETLQEKDLPLKYAGYSHCFRQEKGAYGQYSKGFYRVHQFTKVEMFIYTRENQSEKAHQELLSLEEKFWQSLNIPYRVLEMCKGDLGSQAVKKYDLEAWMSGRGDWGEITSTSNTTDYQSRRLNIKYRTKNGLKYTHTLNGTLFATSRALISILENYQTEKGSVKIPRVLQKYMGKKLITSKNNLKLP